MAVEHNIKQADDDANKYYRLIHPGGPKGIVKGTPKSKKQDAYAKSLYLYGVVFYPKITNIGDAQIEQNGLRYLSITPLLAIQKFMESIAATENWEVYEDAGWKVRLIEIKDLGDCKMTDGKLPD